MAKKKETAKAVDQVMEQQVETVVAPKKEVVVKNKPKWEIRDRVYVLSNGKSPLTATVKSRGIFWFDEDKGYEREIMATKNQRTVFVDEFKGQVLPERIVFKNGTLFVPKNKTILQKFLSMYHPSKNIIFEEVDNVKEAVDDLQYLNMELEAMTAASNIDIDVAEAIMRAEIGSEVSKMSSKELKRDVLLFARRNPGLFLELLNDDNIQLRNTGVKATELGIINLSGDNRTFSWGNTGRKLMTVPFDEHPYSALAAWFKTDEGMEVLNSIEKRLN